MGTGKTVKSIDGAMLEPGREGGIVSCSKPGQWQMLLCCCSLSLACAIDDRPGRPAEMPVGNGETEDPTGSVPAGSAGSSNDLPGGPVPGGPPNPAAGDQGTPDPALLLNGGGAAGSPSMMMGSSGAGPGSVDSGVALGSGGAPGGGAAAGGGAAGSGNGTAETEVIGGCFNQLLSNGGFEREHTGWSEVSEAVHDVVVRRDTPLLLAAGMTPQAGDYLAWIGGIPNGDFRMYHSILLQTVAIPAEAISLTLSGYYWVSQPEPNGVNVDWAVLETEDPDPNVTALWVIKRFDKDSDNNSNGWVRFEVTTLEPALIAAGKTVTVRAASVPNGNGTLSLWLDSLRLEARCPR